MSPINIGVGNCQDWLQIENAPRNGEFLCEANVSDLKELLDEYSCKAWDIQGNRANPTRLLDLEASNTTDGICLTEVSSQDRLKYAALSYCWGPEKDAKTQTILTTENLADRLADITFHSLSPVMQDAVVATRKLGIRYLWIDALCIIQNSPEDWETQSSKMGDIYANCFTSIEALASSSCREGFLSRPEPLTINFQSTIRPSIRGTFGLRFHSTQSLRRDPFAKSGYGAEFETAWTDRGWYAYEERSIHLALTSIRTLQETVLPHTQISFGASRLCFSHDDQAFLEPFEGDRVKVMADTTFNTPATSHDDRWRVYSHWQKLLIDYGCRATSRLSDRLPALSGLAQRIASITGDEYIAGHWKECMTMSLPWLVVYSDSSNLAERLSQLSCPQPYIAPSWSWANIKPVLGKQYIRNQITTRLPRPEWCYLHSECHVSSVWSEPVSQLNPFGAITYAELRPTGRLVEVPRGLHRDKRPHWFPLDQVWLAGLGEDDIAICMLDWSEAPQTDFLKGNFLLLLTSSWSDVPEDSLFMWPLHEVGNTFRINPPCTYERTLLPDRPASSKDEGVHGGEKSRENPSDERSNDNNMSKTHPRSGHTEEQSLEGEPTKDSARQPFNDTPSVYNPSSNNDPALPDAMSALHLDNQEEHDNQNRPPVTRPRGPNRMAMGIVLHAAPDRPGKYYRVGCFESHPAQGGTDAFERFKEREVHLI
ncbi:HET-domain-containing protein [Aaosphaeria arxii CBS 175.79]|uniref:HET-domain-containing protein n=1 Tax=Aaosphaeria arxii CBS 175.79 TaxID=1450172 RepID=A0A6A5Y0C0_9PLEO|nr:HET-domain-containing protein [Aaosphaeria arxii CBS 175.79]KAF2018004.1 HET-domain-containing protein [Aaosphaeria arxii CBS 175.79]